MKVILAFLILVGCAASPKVAAKLPDSPREELLAAAANIEPQLAYCEGLPVYPGENPVTHRPDCANGDGILWGGLLETVAPNAAYEEGVRQSCDPSGRCWRSSEHKGRDTDHTFSRDMVFGIMFYLLKTKDTEFAKRFWQYAYDAEYRVCPDSDACFLTPSVLDAMKGVWQNLGLSVPEDMKFDEDLIKTEQLSAVLTNGPGYQLHLVSLHMYVRMLTGNFTEKNRSVLDKLYNKWSSNLWFKSLYNAAHGGDSGKYDEIASALLPEMSAWPRGVKREWAWQADDGTARSMGHDLVFLAKFLGGQHGFMEILESTGGQSLWLRTESSRYGRAYSDYRTRNP